jgi:propanediol dehydratase small subunit
MAIELATDDFLAAQPVGLTDADILNIFADTPPNNSSREHLLAIGRAIEARVLALQAVGGAGGVPPSPADQPKEPK